MFFRRRLEAEDIIILDEDMELEQVNNNVPGTSQAAGATGGGGDMTCGGCGSPRPAGKEQKKSYRAQKRILISSSPGMYYSSLCLVT